MKNEREPGGQRGNYGHVPTTNASTGGRYCSIITVEVGKALVSERKMARTATAFRWNVSVTKSKCYDEHQPSTPEEPLVVRSADSQTRSLPVGSLQRSFFKVTHLAVSRSVSMIVRGPLAGLRSFLLCIRWSQFFGGQDFWCGHVVRRWPQYSPAKVRRTY